MTDGFYKKVDRVRAFQWGEGLTYEDIPEWAKDAQVGFAVDGVGPCLTIPRPATRGVFMVRRGDWVLMTPDGELSIVGPSKFAAMYQEV